MKKNVASKRPGVVFLMKSVIKQDIPGRTHKAYSFLMHTVTCWGSFVTYKTGFGMDDWVIDPLYIHTTRDYRQYSATADLHTLQFTDTQALGFSAITSRILATDLSQSHCHFKSDMESSSRSLIPFLPLFCSCQFRRLGSIQFLCSQAHIPTGWRLEARLFTSLLDHCSILLNISL
jgi:hypothetical protein